MEKIVLSIDGKTVTASSGTSILEAAGRNKIQIPRLCHHPDLKPAGSCRLCLVEDEKTGRLAAACVTPVAAGQKILTQTPRVLNHRRNIVRLMIAEHPESCVVCSKGNRCALRMVAATLGIGETNLYPMPNFKPFEQANPFITRDLSKCILCGKCIRTDHELVVVGAIDFAHRGFASRPATVHHTGLEKSSCTFCGTCVSICPTGALGIRHTPYVGTPERESDTTCGFCPVGCRLAMGSSGNKVVEVNPSPRRDTVNKATLCVRGHFGHDFLNSSRRLLSPMIRKEEEKTEPDFVPVSWDAAIANTIEGLLRVKAENGPQSIGFLGSSKCTNEENYLFQKIARTLFQTNNIDNGGYASGQMLLAELDKKTLGKWRKSPLEKLETAESIMVISTDPTHSAPVAGYHIKRAAKKGVPLIVADSRQTELAANASSWLHITPGSDLELLNGLAALFLQANGYDRTFIDKHTEGFSLFRYGLSSLDLDKICHFTGLKKEMLETAVSLLKGKKISFVLGRGILQLRNAQRTMGALINLQLMTGGFESETSGIYLLAGENNHVGALDMGAVPGMLPGRQGLEIDGIRKRWEKTWRTSLSPDPGLNMVRMIEAAEQGTIKALYIMGENPLRALPEPPRVMQALEKLDFLVVQDILEGETVRMADVVLPGAAFCEKAGSFTNLEGRVQAFDPVVSPPGHAKPDWEILDLLWANLGKKEPYGSVRNIRREIERLVPMYPEVPPDGQGWLMSAANNDLSGGSNGLIPFAPVAASELYTASEEYPFTASFDALRYHVGSGTRTSASPRFEKMITEEYVELSPEDADSLGFNEGERVTIRSTFGEVERRIMLSKSISRGHVFITAGTGRNGTPVLIGLNDLSGPEASGWASCPVNLEKR